MSQCTPNPRGPCQQGGWLEAYSEREREREDRVSLRKWNSKGHQRQSWPSASPAEIRISLQKLFIAKIEEEGCGTAVGYWFPLHWPPGIGTQKLLTAKPHHHCPRCVTWPKRNVGHGVNDPGSPGLFILMNITGKLGKGI